jgi:hypothetical protein
MPGDDDYFLCWPVSGLHLVENRLLEAFAHPFEGDALHDGVEKAFNQDTFGIFGRDATTLEIKQRFLFQLADRGPMRAAHIIGQDFQPGDRIGPGLVAQHQVAIGLVAIGFLRARRDVNHPLPDGAAFAFERALEEQVAGGVGGQVVLLGVMVEVLGAVGEVETGHATRRALADQVELGEVFGQLRADCARIGARQSAG